MNTQQRLIGKDYLSGKSLSVEIEGRTIAGVEETTQTPGLWIAPALVDLQINGFAGHDVNGLEASTESVTSMVEVLWTRGVAASCPTVISASSEAILTSLKCVSQACRDRRIEQSILGIHLEGPYISAVDGPRGAHPLEHVRPPDWEEFCRFQEAAEGRIRLVTLAPEVDGAPQFIDKLVAQKVVVSLGHTNATSEDIETAVKRGAKLSTHLGNGAHSLLPRHPNYIWDQLARDDLMASFIADGHHLPPSVVKSMIRAKETGRSILVSDAVALGGLPPGRYQTAYSRPVEVSPEGRISITGTPYLFGAGASLEEGVANVVRFAGVSLADAIHMASLHPALLLSRKELGALEPGKQANIILFDWNQGRIRIHQTLLAGEPVFNIE